MKPRTASRLAWSIGTVSIALLIGALVLMFVDRDVALPASASSQAWNFSNVLSTLVNILVPTIGILLASRRPKNRIGWLFLAAGLGLGLSAAAYTYGLRTLVADPGSLPAGRAAAWVGNSVGLIPLGVLAFLFLLFPTGHLRSRRWLPVAWYIGAAFVFVTATGVVFATQSWTTPYNQSSSGGLVGFLAFAVFLLGGLGAALVAVVVRFRRSVGDERLQLKWFVTGAALVFVSFLASFFGSSSATSSPPAIVSVFQSLTFVFLYTAIAIAVLKYRLYDIDVVINKTLVYGLVAAFFTAVYVVLVVGIGIVIGSTHGPSLTLVTAAVIALAFNPVRERAKRLADRLVYGERATPYEVLSDFSERMSDTYALDDILPRMARVLSEGTAGRSQIWLRVGDVLRSAAIWPDEEGPARAEELPITGGHLPAFAGVSKGNAVLQRGELLGAITVTKPPNDPLRPAEEKLIEDVASQAGLVLRNVRLIEELRASRQRLVKAQDQERRRIERNIHDGAQQQLVAMSVKLRLLGELTEQDPERARSLAADLQAESTDALENLRDLARGIYPPLLADKGLAQALESQARKSSIAVTVESDGVGRYPQDIEAALYFCCLEALQNIAKYAEASGATVRLSDGAGTLTFEVTDDGRGFDPVSTGYGTGLQGMADRLDALGGSLDVRSEPGRGTTITGSVPASPGAI
jgi:signal transduction histidine kinase